MWLCFLRFHSSFFVGVNVLPLCMIYSVILTIQNTIQPKKLAEWTLGRVNWGRRWVGQCSSHGPWGEKNLKRTKLLIVQLGVMADRSQQRAEDWGGGGGWVRKGGVRRPPTCPIGPFHPAAVWRLQQWTWACSRSSGWATAAGSSFEPSSSPPPPSPSATAPPSCPSPPQRSCCHWACRKRRMRKRRSRNRKGGRQRWGRGGMKEERRGRKKRRRRWG